MAVRQSPRRMAAWDLATCYRGSRFLTSSAAKSSATGTLGDLRSGCPSLDRAWKFSTEEEAQSKSSGASNHRYLLPALALIPGVDLLAGFILGDSVSLLNYPLELFLAAVDLGEVVVGQFSPLLLHGAFHLLPISFDPVPVHRGLLPFKS